MATNFWITWLEIACERERAAADARRQAEKTDGGEYAVAISEELRAAMVAVAGSALAHDGFYGMVSQVGTRPPSSATWDTNRTPRRSRILETLKHNFDIGKHAHHWEGEFRWLFDLRDAAVHHTSELRPVAPHPTGRANVSQETVDYSLEAAQRAVDLAMEVMTTCLESPRPDKPAISGPRVPDMLRGFRSSTP